MFAVSRKTMIAGAIGNALEMYDYVIWGVFSLYLSREFLPPNSNLSDIFFLFFITYILRPVGGFIGGILADQYGRKKILTLSIVFMGIGTCCAGILPSYEKIGVTSVFLLLFIRLIQVFSMGSEYISSITLLIESCEKNKKGYFGSWVSFGVNLGMLIASLVGALILYLIDIHALPPWGWRFAFIIAFMTTIVGFWIRNSLPESYEFIIENARSEHRAFYTVLQEAFKVIKFQLFESLLVFSLVCFGVGITVLIFVYSPIHMTEVNSLNAAQSLIINSSSLTCLILLIPLFGLVSDSVGRLKTLLMGIILFLMLIIPYFTMLSSGTFLQVLAVHTVIGIPCACIFAITPVFITEMFPLSTRCSATNLIYTLASSIGRGLIPLLALKLQYQNNYFPGFIMWVLGFSSLTLLCFYLRNKKGKSPLVLVEG